MEQQTIICSSREEALRKAEELGGTYHLGHVVIDRLAGDEQLQRERLPDFGYECIPVVISTD